MKRKIVRIDEDKCTGCGQCATACAEGAIEIIDGKARLISENYCDGLGACLGTCPADAIIIEERDADAFDPAAVEEHLAGRSAPEPAARLHACPGSMARTLTPPGEADEGAPAGAAASQLRQWPLQLALLPPTAPYFDDADLLIAADCVGFAMPDFHRRLLKGRAAAIACPKLDDVAPYVEKLAAIFSHNHIRSVTVAHMEVPCCTGIVRVVEMALKRAGSDLDIRDLTVGIDGRIRE
jgi:NAD-dependent dihydropyrimidine dehydrogenase PreA subunit